nr:hypothetical protein [Arsenicicoccus piscis]
MTQILRPLATSSGWRATMRAASWIIHRSMSVISPVSEAIPRKCSGLSSSPDVVSSRTSAS